MSLDLRMAQHEPWNRPGRTTMNARIDRDPKRARSLAHLVLVVVVPLLLLAGALALPDPALDAEAAVGQHVTRSTDATVQLVPGCSPFGSLRACVLVTPTTMRDSAA